MGNDILDQFSFLHLAVGYTAYFLKIPFNYWFFMHMFFEFYENTPEAIVFIQNHIPFWPGEKHKGDSLINSISDQIFAMLGWWIASKIDMYYK